MVELEKFVGELKAAGEVTRLRLLALLAQGELNVKDLTIILEQSQPRISRHLKLLMDNSLIIRHAEGAWAYFGLNYGSEQAQFVYSLISRLDLNDKQLRHDREKLKKLQAEKRKKAKKFFDKIAKDWDEIRSLHISEDKVEEAILSFIGKEKCQLLLDLGTGTGRMLELLKNNYHQAIGIDSSKEMIEIARAKLVANNINNATVRLANIERVDDYYTSANMIILHQVLHYFDDPKKIIFLIANLLTKNGKVLIVDFAPHNFEILRTKYAHQRMGIANEQLRYWAKNASLTVNKFIEIDNNKQQDGLKVCLWLLESDK